MAPLSVRKVVNEHVDSSGYLIAKPPSVWTRSIPDRGKVVHGTAATSVRRARHNVDHPQEKGVRALYEEEEVGYLVGR